MEKLFNWKFTLKLSNYCAEKVVAAQNVFIIMKKRDDSPFSTFQISIAQLCACVSIIRLTKLQPDALIQDSQV